MVELAVRRKCDEHFVHTEATFRLARTNNRTLHIRLQLRNKCERHAISQIEKANMSHRNRN